MTECELEKLKAKIYFLEADLLELQSVKEDLQKNYKVISDEIISPDTKDISDSKTSESSESPERFEIIDKNMSLFKKNDTEDNISNSSFNASDWTKISVPEKDLSNNSIQEICCDKEREFNDLSMESFTKDVFSLCYIDVNRNVDYDVLNILSESIDLTRLVHIISQSLLKVIPNIILNKREEAISLLMIAIYLNPKASERDKLLQQLFHLKKRPTENERLIILAAVIGIAKYAGEQLVENEILPQCWLQLTHKHVERRLLVAEACTVLVPYVSSPIRNSLILSMLQQMLEDKEEIIREQIVKALALLFCQCEDPDKYSQCEQITLNTLNDSSNSLVNVSSHILFPVLAKWALQAGYLNSSLLKKLLHRLSDHIKHLESQPKVSQDVDKVQRILAVIDNLLPFLFMLVAYHEDVINNIEKDVMIPIGSDFSRICSRLTNPKNFMKSDLNTGTVLFEFDKYIFDNPNASWPEMDWVIDVMLPSLFNDLHHIELAQQSVLEGFLNLFSHICIVFGQSFIKYKVRPILHEKIQKLEQVISSFNQFCPSLNIIPVYVTILHFTQDNDEISSVLLPSLFNDLHHIELAQQSVLEGFLNLFSHICIVFGQSFIKYKVRPILHEKIQKLEQVISSFNQFCPSLNIIPVYVTILHFTQDNDEISSVLKKFLCALPLCGSPLDCLDITVRKLCEAGLQDVVVDCLWAGVAHQRPLVKSAAASLFCSIVGNCSEELLKSKVAAAIVTLANDSDILVRTATIPALGRLITNCSVKEIHDKAYMQLQMFINDPTLKENHTLSRQLIVTMGNISVSSGSNFRNDVILPQLTSFSMFMSQMTNHTRKIDMALALVDAFTHVVYSPLNKEIISTVVKPGLKCLESVISENPTLSIHQETVCSMIKECDNKSSQSSPRSPVERSNKLGQNVNQGVEEMRQRMSKIFNKPSMAKSNTLPNLQGIFKKK